MKKTAYFFTLASIALVTPFSLSSCDGGSSLDFPTTSTAAPSNLPTSFDFGDQVLVTPLNAGASYTLDFNSSLSFNLVAPDYLVLAQFTYEKEEEDLVSIVGVTSSYDSAAIQQAINTALADNTTTIHAAARANDIDNQLAALRDLNLPIQFDRTNGLFSDIFIVDSIYLDFNNNLNSTLAISGAIVRFVTNGDAVTVDINTTGLTDINTRENYYLRNYISSLRPPINIDQNHAVDGSAVKLILANSTIN